MKIQKKLAVILTLAAMLVFVLAVPCFAADTPDFMKVVEPIVALLNSLLKPLMAIVGAAGALYCVVLGIKYARAEEPQDREKAKAHLKNALIGFILIFGMIVVLNLLMNPMLNWVASYQGTGTIK